MTSGSIDGKVEDLTVYQEEPFNAGTPMPRLADALVTPTELVYARNHAPVPRIDAEAHRLHVGGRVVRALDLSLADLAERFERVELTAALCCAGNRRAELMEVAEIRTETPWSADAVSNLRWSGWRLRDVLDAAGVDDDGRHVCFRGLDQVDHDGDSEEFGGSIPLSKARREEVLLADRMNGAQLLPVHGHPLRVVVPGYIGARSVKWLAEIEVTHEPSRNHYQRRAYRLFPPEVDGDDPPWEQGRMLGELPLSSAICRPADGATVSSGPVELAGYALVGGGRRIERVEVTADGGDSWTVAGELRRSGPWGWTLWRAELPLPAGRHEVAARAVDENGATQPEELAPLWNFKGYVNHAWHRVTLTAT